MNTFLRRWLSISFLNLLIVSTLGVLMRYKIAFSLPFIQQKFVLHSHSHFAFTGWITHTLMVLLVFHLSISQGESVFKKYRWLLWANLITAYGMLISFFVEGYAFFSISFSTLSLFVSYIFAVYYWRDLNKSDKNLVSTWWFKASLMFSVISSLGAYSLAYIMVNRLNHQNWYLASIYFFLHFQYNGWFFFAGMGLLFSKLEIVKEIRHSLKQVFWLFCFACVPAYFLSALWLPFPFAVYCIIIAAVIAQLFGWGIMLKIIVKQKEFIRLHFSRHGRILLTLSAIAFSIKILLQSGSVHPALSQLSYGFRPIIIGYLHLVLLGVTSIFLIGYIISFNMISLNKILFTGIVIFVIGVIVNELLLMLQGISGLDYIVIPHMDIYLLIAALILFTGIGLMYVSNLKKIKIK